uniref:Secreted protein n=1 Tax=Triticum urartu TaxID=4572 RepID=A0A8R7TKW5_TRIUA
MASTSRRMVASVLFVHLLLVATEMGATRVAEARHGHRLCESQSHRYRGACWRDERTARTSATLRASPRASASSTASKASASARNPASHFIDRWIGWLVSRAPRPPSCLQSVPPLFVYRFPYSESSKVYMRCACHFLIIQVFCFIRCNLARVLIKVGRRCAWTSFIT